MKPTLNVSSGLTMNNNNSITIVTALCVIKFIRGIKPLLITILTSDNIFLLKSALCWFKNQL